MFEGSAFPVFTSMSDAAPEGAGRDDIFVWIFGCFSYIFMTGANNLCIVFRVRAGGFRRPVSISMPL